MFPLDVTDHISDNPSREMALVGVERNEIRCCQGINDRRERLLTQEVFMSTVFKKLNLKDQETILVLDAPESECRTILDAG